MVILVQAILGKFSQEKRNEASRVGQGKKTKQECGPGWRQIQSDSGVQTAPEWVPPRGHFLPTVSIHYWPSAVSATLRVWGVVIAPAWPRAILQRGSSELLSANSSSPRKGDLGRAAPTTHMHTHIHMCVHTYAYILTHTHMHTCTYMNKHTQVGKRHKIDKMVTSRDRAEIEGCCQSEL